MRDNGGFEVTENAGTRLNVECAVTLELADCGTTLSFKFFLSTAKSSKSTGQFAAEGAAVGLQPF